MKKNAEKKLNGTVTVSYTHLDVYKRQVYEYIEGKVVLITGVGSIGSELARQIASHHPKHLILFDIYENNAYDIQLELKKKYPNLKLDTIIGSVRDSRKIFDLFEQYRPEIVYHAAAHKHVPLMEDSPCEAVKNNCLLYTSMRQLLSSSS